MNSTASPATDYTVKAISYTVQSSKPGEPAYTVTCSPIDGDVLDCNCKSRKYRPNLRCRHMCLVGSKDHGGLKPHVRVAVRTQPVLTPAMRAAQELYA